jgi:hypothetical protein
MSTFTRLLSPFKGKNIGAAARAFFGSAGIGQRVGLGGMYLGAGWVGSKLAENFTENQKAYYGESRFKSYYGSFGESASSMVFGLGALMGISAGLARDPISRALQERRNSIWRATRASRMESIRTNPRYSPSRKIQKRMYLDSEYEKATSGARLTKKYLAVNAIMIASTSLGLAGPAAIAAQVGVGAAGLAGAAGLGVAAVKAPATMATLGVGGYVGWQVATHHNSTMAEGNIIDMRQYSDSAVRRMNYSTAGLVQALHNNNRKIY